MSAAFLAYPVGRTIDAREIFSQGIFGGLGFHADLDFAGADDEALYADRYLQQLLVFGHS